MTPEAAIAEALDCYLYRDHGDMLGVAVSGGGDSMALLVLVLDWAAAQGFRVRAVTVDHGLRAEAAAEAAFVGRFCAERGVPHDLLRWAGRDAVGNLMAEARKARRVLLRDWVDGLGLAHVLVGHTADDQAETFLMRLARGSGVDGLAGMTADDGDLFLRPLLGIRRAVLRDLLTGRGVEWVDDPTNEDTRFDRIKARQMLPVLADLGLTVDRVLATMLHMNRARISLGQAAAAFAARHVRAEGGDLIFAPEALHMTGGDSAGRVLAAAVRWIGGSDYRPRYRALTEMAQALRAGDTRTLNGVLILPEAHGARLTREAAAAREVVHPAQGATDVIWDRRWRLIPPADVAVRWDDPVPFSSGLTIRALGDDVGQCKCWRDLGAPRIALMGTPAVYRGDRLLAAPAAGLQNGWQARIVADFSQSLLSH